MRRRYLVLGEAGAVQFLADRYDPASPLASGRRMGGSVSPDGAAWVAMTLGFHSPVPLQEWKAPEECDVLEGPCYFECDGMVGEDLLQAWAQMGWDEGKLWDLLELAYQGFAALRARVGHVEPGLIAQADAGSHARATEGEQAGGEGG